MATAAAEATTPSEQAFDEWRRRIGVWLGPAIFLAVLWSPLGLAPAAHRAAAIVALAITYWITEAIPLPATALLGPTLAVALGVTDVKDAFAPFADPVIYLFLGSFLIAEALHVHGLDQRIALGVLGFRQVGASPQRVRLAVAFVTAAISMWISNTATAAMMLPVVLGIVQALNRAGLDQAPRGLLIVVAYAASIGGIATPVGTPPNLIGLGFLERLSGRDVDFLSFMAIGLPMSLVLSAALVVLARATGQRQAPATSVIREFVTAERGRLAPWGAGQTACGIAFGAAVTLWLLPGFAALVRLPPTHVLAPIASLPESVVAVLVALGLFLWPVGRRRALTWKAAAGVDWGTLLLFGGGLSLGKIMFDTGLAEHAGRLVVAATGVSSLWGLTALSILLAIALTEVTSNTAAVNMLAPIVIALAAEIGVSPVPPVLGTCFGASMAFMLPISTPPNAIVYGTGLVPLTYMLKMGVLMDVVAFFVIFALLRVLCPLLGFA